MKAIPKFHFTESVRKMIASTLVFAHILFILDSLGMIGIGIFLKFVVESKVSLTSDYNRDLLPCVMVAIGILNLIVNIIGASISYLTYDVDKRSNKLRLMHLPYVCISLFDIICLFAVSILTLGHIGTLHSTYRIGLREAMKQYKTNMEIKTAIDRLQIDFRCCGSIYYTDWFLISWRSNDVFNLTSVRVQEQLFEGEYYNDDVPFSCCNPEAIRPCIHHFVSNDSKHFNYHHKKNTTLQHQGCHESLMNFFSKLLRGSFFDISLTCFIQLVLTVHMQFLLTSAFEAIDSGNPELIAPGWLIGSTADDSITRDIELNHNENAKKLSYYEGVLSER